MEMGRGERGRGGEGKRERWGGGEGEGEKERGRGRGEEGVGGADYVNRPSTFWLRVYILFIVQTLAYYFCSIQKGTFKCPL